MRSCMRDAYQPDEDNARCNAYAEAETGSSRGIYMLCTAVLELGQQVVTRYSTGILRHIGAGAIWVDASDASHRMYKGKAR
jgi:hypothetical protein